jgi:hypothetical protein
MTDLDTAQNAYSANEAPKGFILTEPTGGFAAFLERYKPTANGLASITLPVKEFITVKTCPPVWKVFDLYRIHDEEVTFYIGKSEVAFFRIWQHILDGYKGRSTIGRFILCNWRASMNFTLELMNSRSSQFKDLDNDLSAVERSLIAKHSPCFNVASNPKPTPLPAIYLPTTSPIEHARQLRKVIREAVYVLKGELRRGWLAELADED